MCAGVIWLLFFVEYLHVIGVWLGEDQRTSTIKTHIEQRFTMWSNFINYSPLNSEDNWDDLCIQVRNRQTCTSDYQNDMGGGSVFSMVFFVNVFIIDLLMQCTYLKA